VVDHESDEYGERSKDIVFKGGVGECRGKNMNLSGDNRAPGFGGIFYRGPALRDRPKRSPCVQDHAMSPKIMEIVIDIKKYHSQCYLFISW
jgi:hypothetical protein